MDKGPGGQNGGNHYCRAEYGEKDEDSLRDLSTLNTPFAVQGSWKEKRERKDLRKYLKR